MGQNGAGVYVGLLLCDSQSTLMDMTWIMKLNAYND